jgi:hypothetical protein
VNKIETVDTATKKRILALCKQLNPTAKVLEASYSKINVKEIVNTNLFTFEKAATGAGWLRSLHELSERDVGGKMTLAPKPETEEYGITNFVYSARRPFHPKKLFDLIHDKFIVLQNVEKDEEDDEDSEGSHMEMDEASENGYDPDAMQDGESDAEMEDELKDKKYDIDIPTDVSQSLNKRKRLVILT